ncbi:MAG: ORF6N domain-containing protein [Lentisphaeria bacterium]|nr:ORF6N domain-containing protein [Lentisphaeria bacterium]
MSEDLELPSATPLQTLQRLIYTVRGVQVMLDSDLAALYKVETKTFNQAVKRNIERFPESFRFQLSAEEYQNLRSQFVTSSGENAGNAQHGGRRYLPFVFTEQGVAMLSSVLHSEFAVQTSIKIMNAFVEMRHIIASTATLFSRLETLERRQIADQHENDKKFDLIFDALDRQSEPAHGIFFDGQIYDAYKFINNLIALADSEIVLIDGYVDLSVLDMLARKKTGVKVTIVTNRKNSLTIQDIQKFNAQYPILKVRRTNRFHDRFLIIDQQKLYHIGASMKDLGVRCFGFSQMDPVLIPEILAKI